MSARAIEDILSVPARLVLGPTSLYPGGYPFSGTPLGHHDNADFMPGIVYEETRDEGFAETRRLLRKGQYPVFSFELLQWDPDVLALIFPTVVKTGTVNGLNVQARIDAGATTGPVAESSSLLVAPFDPRHPCIFVRRPLWQIQASARWASAFSRYGTIPISCWAPRDDSGKPAYSWGRLEEIVL